MKFGLLTGIACLFIYLHSYAQPPGGERPKIGTLTGQVLESVSQKPIPYAKIFLLNVRDSVVATGGLADSLGRFSIEEIQAGPYIAKITSFGFQPLFIDSLMFLPKAPKIELGAVSMAADANQLNQVDVVYEKQEVIAQIDRKVFSMEKQLTSQGGTAIDALQNVPSVTVDSDGNISLRGSANVTILIDGRPSAITAGGLSSIPASSIESIEVITNPSAKYDPDGMSGIINIVLKKNKMKGFNGSIDLSLENGIHPDSLDTYTQFLGFDYNIAASLAYRNKFFNLYTTYSTNWYEGYRNFNQVNKTWYNDVYNMQDQFRTGTHLRQGQMLKLGSDFYINSKNTIGFSVTGNLGREERTGDMFYYLYDSVSRYDAFERISNDPGRKYTADVNVFWNKKFEQPEHRLDFNGQHSRGENTDEGFYTQNIYNPDDLSLLVPNSLDQYVKTVDGSGITTLQLDYYKPLKFTKVVADGVVLRQSTGKFEAGAKTTIRQLSQDYYMETFDVPNDSLNNKYDFTEQVHAAYAIFGQDFDKFKYQVGLRAETVFIQSEIDKDTTQYKRNYQSFYPSVHLVKPITKTAEFTLSYSRRVNRPGIQALNPFSKYTDPYNLTVGNPALNPEYINSIELGFGSYGKKLTFTGSIYVRHMNNMIQRVRNIDANGVSTISWANVDDARFVGSELMFIYKPVKWWKITLSGNLSQAYINSTSGENQLNNSGFSWTSNMSQAFTLDKGWSAQITGFYRSPMVLTQGRSKPMYSLDIAVRKTFLKDKMYVNAKVTDMFNTRQFGYELVQPGIFESSGLWKHQSRRFMITIGYTFGTQDQDKRRRRDSGFSGDGGGDMGM